MFIYLSVWSFLPSDVNRDKIKVFGNLVRCNGFRGKAQKVTCGTVLGITECHVNSQVFHFVNVRQVMSERLPGPLSSFRYNLNAKVEPRPLVFSDKKKILHSLLKVPMNVISNNSLEYAIRTVHCHKSNVEIGYLHIQEYDPVSNASPEVGTKIRSSELDDVLVAGPSSYVQNVANDSQRNEFVPNDVHFTPNQYPELGSETYDQFLTGIQASNPVQGETSAVPTSVIVNSVWLR